MRRHLVGLNLVIACLLGAAVSAQESDRAAGRLLYQDNCGTCHGMIESDARYHFPGESLWQLVQAGIIPSVVWDNGTLDVWIMDSQAWVPDSMMFYKQPDPDIRRKTIAYLEANP